MKRSPDKVWKASEARARFPELVDRALSGTPQVVRRRSGEEVVVLSRQDYDELRPTAKEFLLRGGKGPEQDPIDEAIDEGRSHDVGLLGRPATPN